MAELLARFDPATPLAWLLTYALHGTLLLAAAWLASRLAPGSIRRRERLWKAALLGSLLTATAQVSLDVHPLTARWQLASASGVDAARLRAPMREGPIATTPHDPGAILAGDAAHEGDRGQAPRPAFAGLPARVGSAPSSRAPLLARAGDDARASRIPWALGALCVWLAGVALALVAYAASWRRLARELAGRHPLPGGPLAASVERLRRAAGVRRSVRLYVAPRLRVPVTFGVLRPVICLPARAVRELSPRSQEAVLAHEMAHVARCDPAWLLLCGLIERVFFFQPLLRLARRELQELSELSCDDWALAATGARLPLARSLADVAGWIAGPARALPVPNMAHSGAQLSARVSRILDDGHVPSRDFGHPLSAGAAAAISLATVALLPGVTLGADGPPREPAAVESAPAVSPLSPGSPGRSVLGAADGATRATHSIERSALAEPDVAELRVAADSSADEAELTGPLRDELAALDAELRALRAEVAAGDLETRYGADLEALARQLEEIQAGRARLEALLRQLVASAGAEPTRALRQRDTTLRR